MCLAVLWRVKSFIGGYEMTDIKKLGADNDEKPPSLCNFLRSRIRTGISSVLLHGSAGMAPEYHLPNPNIAFRHLY